MPWNVVIPTGVVVLVVVAWLFRRRQSPSGGDAMPEVGQPPADAEPVAEPRLQDIGAGSYDLPLPTDTADEAETGPS
jgi:hypothetical protein